MFSIILLDEKISGESGKSAEPVKIDLDETLMMIEEMPKTGTR